MNRFKWEKKKWKYYPETQPLFSAREICWNVVETFLKIGFFAWKGGWKFEFSGYFQENKPIFSEVSTTFQQNLQVENKGWVSGLPEQMKPLPEYPSTHRQLKLPIVFVQTASKWHPPLFIEHSSTSIYFNYLLVYLFVYLFVEVKY